MLFIKIFLYTAFAMENQPNYGRTPFAPRLNSVPPGIPEDLHAEAHFAALQAYWEVYNSLNYHNPYLQQQLYMQNLYNTPVDQFADPPVDRFADPPVEQIIDTDDKTCLEDPTLWSKAQFMKCIKQQSGSRALQEVLETRSEAKDNILDFVNSLDADEIVSLSQDRNGNFFMVAVIKYAGTDTVARLMRNLVENPLSIAQMCNGAGNKYSYRVIISLIIFGKKLEKYNEFVSVVKDISDINPYITQQLIKHMPGYRIWLLEEIQRGDFPPTKICLKHIIFLGMYSLEEIGGCLTTERMNDNMQKLLERKSWEKIYDTTTSESNPKFLD